MIIHILASVLALALGQVSRHLIRRLPEIIEEENAVKLLIPTLKKDFKLDVICSAVNLVIFNLLVYFLGMNFQVLMYMLVVSCLQVVFWIDYTMQLIPDTVQVLLWILGLINVVVAFFMSGVMSGINYIAGGLIGGGIFYLLGVGGKIVNGIWRCKTYDRSRANIWNKGYTYYYTCFVFYIRRNIYTFNDI